MSEEPSGGAREGGQARPKIGIPPERQRWLIPALWYGALIIALFGSVIWVMFKEYATDESMGHGFFVPLVVGFLIWRRREELDATPAGTHWSGWALIALGFGLLMLGTFGAEFALMRGGLIVTIYGVVLVACGLSVFQKLLFPLLLLLFMIRIPQFIYGQITFPLQILASQFAETTLAAIGIPVLREGNVLELASQRLNVVEACSGIRSLLSLGFLSLVYGYFFETRTWVRIVLVLATPPIAIVANGLRVTITGILSEINTEYAEGLFHTMEGWVIFMVALLLLHQVLVRAARLVNRWKGAPSA